MAKRGQSVDKGSRSKDREIKRKRNEAGDSTSAPKPLAKSNNDGDETGPREVWSKSKKKRARMMRAKQKKDGDTHDPKEETNEHARPNKSPKVEKEWSATQGDSSSSSLQQAFKARLSGSRFRVLNEELYTTTSSSSFQRFQSNPDLYKQYHDGFRHQVENWPVNPIDVIVAGLKSLTGSLEKGADKLVVADFGCGDAELATQLLKIEVKKKCPFDVHSFDLVASSDLVTACDMANVPLSNSSVDVAIFCLSLMGTNLADFVREAHRVLKKTGKLKITEVRSRFETRGENDELQEFLSVLDKLGFKCSKTDRSNKMFVLLELEKNGKKPKKDLTFTAKPCIYKKR